MNILFSDGDSAKFREAVMVLFDNGGHVKRSEAPATYLQRCRDAWAAAPDDDYYNTRVLYDERITGEGDELYCARLAVIRTEFDASGTAWRTPDSYSLKRKNRTKYLRELIFVSPHGTASTASSEPQKETVLLAFFDVLGFADRFTAIGLDAMYSLYSDLMNETLVSSAGQGKLSRAAGVFAGELREGYLTLPIEYSYFSDTIVMWARFHNAFVGTFLDRCSAFFCDALRSGVPLRGAISFGDAVMHIPKSTFLGAPLIEAARTESAQDWVGVALSKSVRQVRFPPDRVQRFDPPVKPGKEDLLSGLSLDWPRYWRDFITGSAVESLRKLRSEDHGEYYDNAEKYVEFSRKNQDWMMQELKKTLGEVSVAHPQP